MQVVPICLFIDRRRRVLRVLQTVEKESEMTHQEQTTKCLQDAKYLRDFKLKPGDIIKRRGNSECDTYLSYTYRVKDIYPRIFTAIDLRSGRLATFTKVDVLTGELTEARYVG